MTLIILILKTSELLFINDKRPLPLKNITVKVIDSHLQ